MDDPTNKEVVILLREHMANAREKDRADAEWRGSISSTLRNITDEQARMRAQVQKLDEEHAETRRIARHAAESTAELEGRALVAIAQLTTKTDEQNKDLAEIKGDTKSQTKVLETLTAHMVSVRTGLRIFLYIAAATPVVLGGLWWLFQHLAGHP